MDLFVTPEVKQELLLLKKDALTSDFIIETFSEHAIDKKIVPAKHRTTQRITLKAGEYINTTDIETNVGIFLFNKYFIENRFEKIIPNGYYNEVLTAKNIKKLFGILSTAAMEQQITVQDHLVPFLIDYEFFLKLCGVFSPSFTKGTVIPNKEVAKKRDDFLKKHHDGDDLTLAQMVDFEDDLVATARKANDKDVGMTLYNSGARGSFDNDYKNISVMIGPVANPQTGGFDMMTSNYMDGIKKKDLPYAGNMVVAASYPKAVGTAVGGHFTKQFYAVFQTTVIDKLNKDCGSKGTLDIVLTEDDIDDFVYQNVVDSTGKLVMITEENKKQFINKLCHIRSPMYCLSDKICAACAGDKLIRLDIDAIGLMTPRVSNNMMNANMKKFHNSKVKINEVNINKLLI